MTNEQMAIQLHDWYLEATKEIDPINYNEKAQVPFEKLNDEQKYIDVYIAEKILTFAKKIRKETIEECAMVAISFKSSEYHFELWSEAIASKIRALEVES